MFHRRTRIFICAALYWTTIIRVSHHSLTAAFYSSGAKTLSEDYSNFIRIKPTARVQQVGRCRRAAEQRRYRIIAMAAINSTKWKAGIGRPLAPGMLYDCRSDKYLLNVFLYKPESIAGATTRISHVSQKVVEIVEDRFALKASCLEIDSELQLSILAGLVDAKGAAKYLTDYKSSMNQSCIGLLYKQTTKIEQLSLDKLSDQCLDRIESATHVVTEVEYGATAVFVFDSNSCKHDELLDKIRELKQHLSSSSDDVVHLTENSAIRCTFYADIPSCSKVPKTLPEVSHACQSLRMYLAEEANGVPVRVRLHPVGELNNKAHKSLSMQEVSPELSSKIQAIFEPLRELETRSKYNCNSEVCEHIVGIKNDLKDMLQMLASYCVSVKKRLADLLPKVREGDADESSLLQVLEDNETSPFNHSVLRSWIEGKEKEVAILGNYIKSLKQEKKVQFAFQPNEMDVLSNSIEIDTIVCFDFNIIGGKDPQLSKMRSHLNEKKCDPQYLEPWYSSASITKEMKQQVRCFLQLVASNAERDDVVFTVTSGCSEVAKVSGKMPCMCLYTDDNPPVSFEPPSKPGKPQASLSGDSSIQLRWEKPKQGGKLYTVLYRLANSPTDSWITCSSTIEEATITSLLPKQEYVFKIRAETAVIAGPESELSDPIVISASLQPPAKPYATDITHSSLTLHWNKPPSHHQASIIFYTIYYSASHSKDEWIEHTTTDAQPKAIVANLSSNTVYIFKVKAETGSEFSPESEVSDPIETKKVMIAPPGKPCATNITHNSVSLNWTIPENQNPTCHPYYIQSKFPNSVKAYTIRYRSTSDQTDSWETHMTSNNDQHCKISNLKPETNYVFQVIALTSNETSQVSKTSEEIQTKPIASENTAIPLTSQDVDPNVILSSPGKPCFENYQESDSSDQIKTKNLSPPGKPYAGDVTHDSIQLKWDKLEDGAEAVTFYKINYRSTQDKQGHWSMLSTTSPLEWFTITGLQQQTAYIFQVSAVFSESYCRDSQVSEEIQTKMFVSRPSKPIVTGTTCETIQLSWSKPAHGADLVSSYAIHGYINDKWSPLAEGLTEECFTASNLKPGTFHHFKVFANTPTGVQESESSDSIQTEALPLSIRLRNLCPQIVAKRGNLSIHLLEGKITMSKKIIHIIDLGTNIRKITSQHRVLMLVGATGAGKSALINGIANYITGVKWEDDFRFILIPEGDSQTKSQTRQITAYRFLDSILPYTLTVIDTPGFGDTSGIAKDKEIRQLIKEFFSNTDFDQITAIALVAQSALSQLTVSQKYIFENVLTLFGKDIRSNVFLMTTFADGHKPQVLGAVEEAQVPYQSFFKFNNSANFASNTGDSPFDALFWKMGMESFALFFEFLSEAKPRSLTLTRQVLEGRDQLEKIIQSLQTRIHASLAKINELKQEEAILQQQKETIDSTKDFIYTVKRTEKRKVTLPNKKYTTTCLTCDYTCHEECSESNDSRKRYCSVMKTNFGKKNASCVVCPKKCRWDEHFNTPFKYECYQVEEVRTYEDLKARYDTAMSGKTKKEAIIARLRDEIEKCQNDLLSVIKEVKSCLERLNDIALKPNPTITEVEYINVLIKSKEQEQKLGWQEEVSALKKLRETAELQHKIFTDPEAMERKIGIKEKQ